MADFMGARLKKKIQSPTSEPEWITKRAVAARLNVSIKAVDNYVRLGILPQPNKYGSTKQSRVRFSVAEIEKAFTHPRLRARWHA